MGIGEEERETKLVVVEELRIAVRAPKASTHTGSEIATDSDDGSLRAAALKEPIGHKLLSRLTRGSHLSTLHGDIQFNT